MEGAEISQSRAGAAAQAALSKLTPELLLLGLRLLSNTTSGGSKLPCATVQPRPQQSRSPSATSSGPGSPEADSPLKASPPSSPEQNQQVPRSGGRKRKRGESEELSEEQKREKRKLMNRIAAQNARDRKKTYVEDLEKRVTELEAKNSKLQQENKALRQKTDTLASEKQRLEAQLQSRALHPSPITPSPLPSSTLEQEGHTPKSGSAVPLTSLQQKQTLEAFFLRVMVTLNLILWLTCCKTTPGLTTRVDHMSPQLKSSASHMTSVKAGKSIRSQLWWGPHQSMWNPLATY